MLLDFDECSTSNPVCDVNMLTVRIMSDRISIPVKQDLRVTGKRLLVRGWSVTNWLEQCCTVYSFTFYK